jgi:hypothetical protein
MSARTRGGCGVSSLMQPKKKGKICLVIYIAGFVLKFFSVMKCLRSKKRMNAADTTTGGDVRVTWVCVGMRRVWKGRRRARSGTVVGPMPDTSRERLRDCRVASSLQPMSVTSSYIM